MIISIYDCREKVGMSDGGHVCLDWFNERGSSQQGVSTDDSSSEDSPIVLMLPGVTGKTVHCMTPQHFSLLHW